MHAQIHIHTYRCTWNARARARGYTSGGVPFSRCAFLRLTRYIRLARRICIILARGHYANLNSSKQYFSEWSHLGRTRVNLHAWRTEIITHRAALFKSSRAQSRIVQPRRGSNSPSSPPRGINTVELYHNVCLCVCVCVA